MTLGEARDVYGTVGVVRDWSGDPRGGLGRVGEHSLRSGTGRRTFGEVREGSGHP